jgi:transmembrane sensor
MSTENFENLFNKYIQNECTAEELDKFLSEFSDESDTTKEEHRFRLFDKTWQELDVYPGQFNLPPQRVPDKNQLEQGTVVPMRRWTSYLAAAVIVFAVALTTFLWVSRKEEPGVADAKHMLQDIAPGTDRAVLTLADGSKILLDSSTGTLATEGGVAVINLNGQLAYSPSETTATVLYHTISVPRGGQYKMVLADGTKVWLNASSSLRFPNIFTGRDRAVELTGEGYFEVAYNSQQPFSVQVGEMQVEVLGTHFNINSFADEPQVKTTLIEGSVRVSLPGQYQGSVVLRPGEQAQLSNEQKSSQFVVVRGVDTEAILSWKNGWFEFDKTDLKTIMRQISRWYNIEVVYEGTLPDEEFGGRISRKLPLSQILQSLETAGVRFQLRGRILTVHAN